MDTIQVKKIVVVCFLEAAKITLDHLGKHRMTMSGDEFGGGEDLTRMYGDVRRLRDYLQRCAAAHQDEADIEFNEADRAMLVACCRRYVDVIDERLAGPEVTDPKDRKFLGRKQQLIADWTVELAEKPLVDLPLPTLDSQGDGARGLRTRIQDKLFAINDQKIIRSGQFEMISNDESKSGGKPSAARGVALPIECVEASGDSAGSSTPPPLIDKAAIKDPRLRSLAALDLRSLGNAERSGDLRIQSIMMATVLETAVIDYAIRHKEELQLRGGPDTWKAHDVLLKILGDSTSPSDRSLAYHLFAAHKLLSPAHQMITPMVVTVSSVQAQRAFVESMLHQLGFVGAQNTDTAAIHES